MQHLADAGNLRGGLHGASGAVAGNQQVNFTAALERRRDGVERCGLQSTVVVFGYDKGSHLISPLLHS